MNSVTLPFYASVAFAGALFLLLQAAAKRFEVVRDTLPIPIAAGLLGALLLLAGRAIGWRIEVPHQGTEVDFLIALLTTNMGLHVTSRVLAIGLPVFGLFIVAAAALFALQFGVAILVAQGGPNPIETAIVTGPLSYLGAPYNLNPPAQVPPVAALLTPAFSNPEASARGMMMLGVLLGSLIASCSARYFFRLANAPPPKPPAQSQKTPSVSISRFAKQVTGVAIAILVIISLAFALQAMLLKLFPDLKDDHLPVIVIAYLLGVAVRLAWPRVAGKHPFPELALTALLLGPTMSIVLTYAVVSVPLHTLSELSLPMATAGLLAIACSTVLGWLLFPVFAKMLGRYYAAIVATVFIAVTTAWGPVAMSFLRRSTDQSGEVEPMPAILPLNAFFLFPWMAILLTRLVFEIAS